MNIDIVFVIDASASMRPCFQQLKAHLAELLKPLTQVRAKVRLGLVAHSAGNLNGSILYQHYLLGGGGIERVYSSSSNQGSGDESLFTGDPSYFLKNLERISPVGDEDSLIALDIALDFPFGPLKDTKRVVALFSDERFEDGVSGSAPAEKVPQLIEKLHARHVHLFCAIPEGGMANQLAYADRSEVEFIPGGDGLASVNFAQLLGQMGKSISVSSLQAVSEPTWRRAIFGQDQWVGSDESMPEQDN
jgi:hypothetical protein